MHLIFIRHGDPDYAHDSLTEKGEKEARLLNKRVSKWTIEKCYVSPLGRAQRTAELALQTTPLTPITLPWLREFNYPIKDQRTGDKRIAWDWLPHDYFNEQNYFNRKKWYATKAMKSGDIARHYDEVCTGIDSVLNSFGYERLSKEDGIYRCHPNCTVEEASVDHHIEAMQKPLDDRNIVFFCHLGVMFVIISHLTGISPVQLWQGFFVAPTSVTILGAEERVPGEVVFRVQTLGDCAHLLSEDEPPSASGFFGSCLSY
jgi:probable phosphoglycerate mutase